MKILICDNLNLQVLDELSEIGDCTNISNSSSKSKDLIKHIKDSEIIVIRSATKLTNEILSHAKKLKIIARCGVGVDNIDLEFAKSNKISVTNSPAANIISVVELTVALIINASRKISLADTHVKNGKWDKSEFSGVELYGKKLGIVGFGKAGRLVAERMQSFGMSVIFYDPYVTDWGGPEEKKELDELLQISDVISIHVIKTKETENLISKDRLDLLKENSIIINTSRGDVLDEAYLFELLKSKKIYGAGLDVYSNEPPQNIETLKNINIITTPHIGASTFEAQLKAGMDVVDNIKKILSGDNSVEL
tara:strand:- start:357 stop:1280 length:924 start_codon:yes stop_codon:yes gene_type:complete